jgi:hypothetical protein
MAFLEIPAKHGTKGSNGGFALLLLLEVSGVFGRVSPFIFYAFLFKKIFHKFISAPIVLNERTTPCFLNEDWLLYKWETTSFPSIGGISVVCLFRSLCGVAAGCHVYNKIKRYCHQERRRSTSGLFLP